MDPYAEHGIKPMLIGKEQPIFDDPDFIYKLKLDGVRCIAYIEKDRVEISALIVSGKSVNDQGCLN